jgi:hypothetical protein
MPAALFLSFAIGLCQATAEDKPPAKSSEEGTGKNKRIAYVLQSGDAKACADVLSKHFKGDAEVQILSGLQGNCLLISATPAVADEVLQLLSRIDRRPQFIHVEVLVAELPLKKDDAGKPDGTDPALSLREYTGPAAEVVARLEALCRKTAGSELRRVQMTIVEGQPAMASALVNKPVTTGVNRTATGIVSRNITFRQAGATTKATARVMPDQTIEVDLDARDLRIVPSETVVLGKDEGGDPIMASESVADSYLGKVRVTPGQAVAAEGVRTTAKSGKVDTLVVVTAKLIDPTAKPEKQEAPPETSDRPARPPRRPRNN